MRAIGIMQFIVKVLSVFLLGSCGVALAQLNTFYPGDDIKSAEMNENFDYLIQENSNLKSRAATLEAKVEQSESAGASSKVPCAESSVTGTWISASADDDGDYELITLFFDADGAVAAWSETAELGLVELSGDWGIDSRCRIQAFVTSELGSFDVYGWLSDDGNSLPGLVYRYSDSYWLSGTFARYNR